MKKLSFILLTLVVSLNSLALTQEEFFWRLEKDDIFRGGYFFRGGEVNPYGATSSGGTGYVFYKDGTGRHITGSSHCEYIEHQGMRARYCWNEDFEFLWKYYSKGDADFAVIGVGFTSYEINKIEIEMLTTHTDDQFQIIKNIVQQKINKLHQKYGQRMGVPLTYEVLEQRDGINKHYVVLKPTEALPFNNFDFHCPVSKDYQEMLDSKEHKAGTTYTL